ncbi:MAG: cytochrome c oxidase subunit II [Bacteroidales bacterium]
MYSSDPAGVSNTITSYNIAFWYIGGISLLLLAALTATMLWFVFRYNKKRNKVAVQIEGNTKLEVAWTVIPILLALTMFLFGWTGWKPLNKAPEDALNVTSIARMWNFSFSYENGKQNPELIVPVNTPVKINLTSLDVIHSLFIPAFRIKSDMIPGRQKMMWFTPGVEGRYDIFCAEYCGLSHSYMRSAVKVVSKEEFDKWYIDTTRVALATAGTGPGAEGEAIMKAQGCFACHSTDGSRIIGPSYLNLYGEQQTVIRDGKEVTVTVDDAYVHKAIYDPNSETVKGYQKNLMQTYTGVLSQDDVAKIIEYLKSLNQ